MNKIQQYFRYLKDGAGLPWRVFSYSILFGGLFGLLLIFNEYFLHYDFIENQLLKRVGRRLAEHWIYFWAICWCVLAIIHSKFDRLYAKICSVGIKFENVLYTFMGTALGFLFVTDFTQDEVQYVPKALIYFIAVLGVSLLVRALAIDDLRHLKSMRNIRAACLAVMIGIILYVWIFG